MKLVDFYAEWCGPCTVLSHTLEQIIPEYPELEIVKVNVEEEEEETEKYGISNVPTLILLDEDNIVSKKVGAIGKTELKEWLNTYVVKEE